MMKWLLHRGGYPSQLPWKFHPVDRPVGRTSILRFGDIIRFVRCAVREESAGSLSARPPARPSDRCFDRAERRKSPEKASSRSTIEGDNPRRTAKIERFTTFPAPRPTRAASARATQNRSRASGTERETERKVKYIQPLSNA